MIWARSCRSSSGAMHFTVPCVPTGMKTGVSMTPCAVVRRPALAPLACVLASPLSFGARPTDVVIQSFTFDPPVFFYLLSPRSHDIGERIVVHMPLFHFIPLIHSGNRYAKPSAARGRLSRTCGF